MEGENTDDASIKPVSSLRSHFENMTAARPPPPSPAPPSLRTNIAHTKETEGGLISPALPPPGRSSVEVARRIPVRNSPDVSDNERHPPPAPARKPFIPLEQDSATPDNPISPATPRHPAPKVNIVSPRSPPKFIDIPKSAMTPPVQVVGSSTPSSLRSEPPPLPRPRHIRIPSRPHSPTSKAPVSPFLDDSEVPESGIFPPQPPRPKPASDGRISPIPPAFNRAAKPKSRESSATGTARRPVDSSDVNEQASPFNTPPHSNEDSPEGEHPPPIPVYSKPKAALSNIPSSLAFEPPPTHHTVAGKRRELDYKSTLNNSNTVSQSRGSIDIPKRPAEDDAPEIRPSLPPRRDISPHNQAASTTAHRSTEKQIRSSALTQGFGAATTPHKRIEATGTPATEFSAMHLAQNEIKHTPRKSSSQIATRAQPSQSRGLISTHEPMQSKLESTPGVLAEFPDITRSNRRPPFFAEGPRFLSVGYDLRLMDVCGEHVCVTGSVTRVWNMVTGRLLLSLAHGESVKMTAVAFKPARRIEEEGSRVWLGTNMGEIQEIDIPSKKVVDTNLNAHHRRAIVRILRHAANLWTLDEEGKLYVWPPNDKGSPDFSYGIQNPRVARGHSSSVVINDQLWLASGKDIRVFRPNTDPENQTFHVTTQSLSQPGTGDITSSTVIPAKPNIVYFGHSDGRISMYSCTDLTCVGVVTANVFKINSLVGAGSYLWVGYNSGWLYAYDTTARPWRVMKDWAAHENPIVSIVADRSSLWKLDRLQVVSLGADNILSIWDGMLQDDWMEEEMHSIASEFCTFRDVSALVMTWNAGASKPKELGYDRQDAESFKEIMLSGDTPDIVVFGLQELVDLEDKTLTAKSFFKSKKQDSYGHEHLGSVYRAWRDHLTRTLDDLMPATETYTLLHSSSLVGLFSCIFVRASLRNRIRNPEAAQVKTGMGGAYGNKGALVVRFLLDDTSACFINCHLAAGQSQTRDRNNDVAAILESMPLPALRLPASHPETFVCGGDGTMVMDHEICILNGDLNYRIDTMGRDTVISAVRGNNIGKLLDRDQLLLSRRKNPGFRLRSFTEAPIKFWPTYKYDVGTDNYDSSEKKRAPAWCDRILHRGHGFVEQLDYRRHEVRLSDHRPVSARFVLTVKSIQPERRAQCWKRCQQKFETNKRQVSDDAKLEYLTNIFGLSTQEAQKLVSSS